MASRTAPCRATSSGIPAGLSRFRTSRRNFWRSRVLQNLPQPMDLGARQGQGQGQQGQREGSGEAKWPAIAEVSEASRRPKAKKIPDTVSKAELDEHMLTHLPMRSWCDHCMKGKVRESSGRASEVPRISLDYCFLGRALKGEVKSVEGGEGTAR